MIILSIIFHNNGCLCMLLLVDSNIATKRFLYLGIFKFNLILLLFLIIWVFLTQVLLPPLLLLFILFIHRLRFLLCFLLLIILLPLVLLVLLSLRWSTSTYCIVQKLLLLHYQKVLCTHGTAKCHSTLATPKVTCHIVALTS